MPTLNKYSNKPGYHIRAWTQELGNFNYKIKSKGWPLIKNVYRNKNKTNITWKEINGLKSVGLVYTDDSGVIRPSDERFNPDPEKLSSENLSESAATTLLQNVFSELSLSFEELRELSSILGLGDDGVVKCLEPMCEPFAAKSKQCIRSQEELIPNYMSLDEKSDESISLEEAEIEAFISAPEDVSKESSDWEEGYSQFSLVIILLAPGDLSEGVEFIMHQVCFDQNGIPYWDLIATRDSWSTRAILHSQIGALLPIIISELENIGISIPTSEDSLESRFTKLGAVIESSDDEMIELE